MRQYSRLPFLLLIIGLLASLWTAGQRVAVERVSRTVELTIDMEQLRTLTMNAGVPLAEALTRLKEAGVTSVAIGEQSLSELETDGLIEVRQASSAGRLGHTLVRVRDRDLYFQVVDALRLKVRAASQRPEEQPIAAGRGAVRNVEIQGPAGLRLSVPCGWSAVRGVTVGLPSEEVALVRASGLMVVGRVTNFTAADDAAIATVASRLRQAGAHTVIFAGEEVLGHRSRVKQTAAALDAQGLRYGSVEFGKQMGDETLARALRARIVRVHSIQNAELQKLDVEGTVDRFVKAAEERNIRLLYLRLQAQAAEEPFQDNLATIHAIARRLRARGLWLGRAEPFGRVYPEVGRTESSAGGMVAEGGGLAGRLQSRLLPAAAALAVAGGAVLLLTGLVLLPARTQALLALLSAAAAGLVVLAGGDLGRKLVALAGALLFPVLAYVWVAPAGEWQQGKEDRSRENGHDPKPGETPLPRRSPFLQFAAISLISLMGALTVVGLLSERQFMVKVAAFMGIKAAHFLPLVAIGALYAASALGGPRPWPELRERARESLGRLLGERLQVWHMAVGLVALIAVGLLLARTGNDPGVGVSGIEMKLRSVLDRFLVRPRTKEFLIGHPALLAALLLAARRPQWRGLTPLVLIGAIGQVSMLNSFCHLHTPLLLTVARTWNGLWLGALIGLPLAWALHRWLPRASQPDLTAPAPRERVGVAP
jgi:hypothetical protein